MTPNDEFEYYTEGEVEDFFFPEIYPDGYPDELIPPHAFTDDGGQNVEC